MSLFSTCLSHIGYNEDEITRAGLTIVPVVPWKAPAARGPRSTATFFTTLF